MKIVYLCRPEDVKVASRIVEAIDTARDGSVIPLTIEEWEVWKRLIKVGVDPRPDMTR